MLPVLSGPPSLPAIADAVKEASVAWRNLVADAAELASIVEKGDNFTCPFSVSGNGSGGLVEIPCGLVQDSAVTVLGVPAGRNGSGGFWIELIGSGNVVLRVNVSIGGDGVAVSQSSWSKERGWGEWEWCPGLSQSVVNDNNSRVDGLVRCNEQLGETTSKQNLNGSLLDVEKQVGPSKSSLLSSNSPFIEGQPFAATLWAGVEGFHITVNGKHETSFAYREMLEPWYVSAVRVEGDLHLVSLLANGLPVTEDLDLIGDINRLKAPPVHKKRLLMLVAVFSTGNNFQRRMALRRSWMQYESVRSGNVAVRFLTGLDKNKQVNLELWKEAQTYGDIQLMPFVDYYSLITLKAVAACILGTRILPAKYIMKTDDDAFVRIDEVLSSLKSYAPRGLLYGLISFESSPHRDKDSKWFISSKEWPHDSYPPWAHGPGYIISRDIAKFIAQGHQEQELQLFKLEDVAMGIWIQEFKKSGQEVNYVSDERFHNAGCESGYVLAHYQGPRNLLCLWEKLQTEHEAVCCE